MGASGVVGKGDGSEGGWDASLSGVREIADAMSDDRGGVDEAS